jgi:hypothetical protein
MIPCAAFSVRSIEKMLSCARGEKISETRQCELLQARNELVMADPVDLGDHIGQNSVEAKEHGALDSKAFIMIDSLHQLLNRDRPDNNCGRLLARCTVSSTCTRIPPHRAACSLACGPYISTVLGYSTDDVGEYGCDCSRRRQGTPVGCFGVRIRLGNGDPGKIRTRCHMVSHCSFFLESLLYLYTVSKALYSILLREDLSLFPKGWSRPF